MEASEKIRIARIDYISWVSQMIGREDIDVRRREQEVLLKQARASIEAKNVESFFRARDFDNVVVLNYASPTDMHIMKKQKYEEATEFREHLNRTYANNIADSIVDINLGVYCCCKLEDGSFHRCRITRVLPDELCRVRLVDTGVKHTVAWKNCRMLTNEFAKKSAYATKVTLIHTKSMDPVKHYSPAEARQFKKLIETQSEIYAYTHTKSKISNAIYLYYKEKDSSEFTCMNRLFASHLGSDSTDSDQSIKVLSPNAKKAASSQFTKRIIGKINYFQSPEAVYVTVEKFYVAKQTLRTDIQNAATINERSVEAVLDTKFEVDDFCMVWCSIEPDRQQNKEWHRAKILELKENGDFVVFLRDHGERRDANDVDILPLPDEIAKVQDLAMKVSLFGVKSKAKEFDDETVREKLAELIKPFDDLAISFYIEEYRSAVVWGVEKRMFALAPTQYTYTNLNIELVKAGVVAGMPSLNKSVHVEHSKAPSDDNTSDEKRLNLKMDQAEGSTEPHKYVVTDKITAFNKWKRTEKIDQTIFIAFPTYINSNLDFYALDDQCRNTANNMEKIIYEKISHRKTLPLTEVRRKPIEEWKAGHPCFAPFDNSYYRAKIKRIHKADKTCSVRFIDYGNVERCYLSDLFVANMFGDIPELAQKYFIPDLVANTDGKEWSTQARSFCEDAILNKQCLIELIKDSPPSQERGTPCKLLVYTKDKTLADALRLRGFAAPKEEK